MKNDLGASNFISNQIVPWSGNNKVVNEALESVPRSYFVPEKWQDFAYADTEIPLSKNVYMFSPKVEAKILNILNIQKSDHVLQIGTGSGYLTVVLSLLSKSVLSLEIDEQLQKKAQDKISKLKIENVCIKHMDAMLDFNDNNFYDVILIAGALSFFPKKFSYLLNKNGRLLFFDGKNHCMSVKLITCIDNNNWQEQIFFETNVDYIIGGKTKVFCF